MADVLDCNDCGVNTWRESYMLHDHVWATVAPPDAILYVGCVERKLTPDDFSACLLNNQALPIKRSVRLRRRLGWSS